MTAGQTDATTTRTPGPRVSWLVPVFNAGRYLERAMASVQAQSFADFVVVVVDDGSTDDTPAILARLRAADSRFVVVSKPNSGIIDALNLGLSHCTGEYVARMDGDDLCEPNRLATQVAYLDSHPDCVAVGSRTVIVDENDRVLRNSAATVWKVPGPGGFPPRSVTMTHPTILARTEAMRAAGGYRHGFYAAEDYDLLFRLARLGRLVELPDRLLRYRVHSQSESVTKIGHQRLSAMKAELDAFLHDRGGDAATMRRVLDSRSIDDLCAAAAAGPSLPDPVVIRAHYLAEYLRRATYRSTRAEARQVAANTAWQALRLVPHLSQPAARPFFTKAVRELGRWAVVTATGRDGRSKSPTPVRTDGS